MKASPTPVILKNAGVFVPNDVSSGDCNGIRLAAALVVVMPSYLPKLLIPATLQKVSVGEFCSWQPARLGDNLMNGPERN